MAMKKLTILILIILLFGNAFVQTDNNGYPLSLVN